MDNFCEVLMVDLQGYVLVIILNDGFIWEVINSMWVNFGIVNLDIFYRFNYYIYYFVVGDIFLCGNEIFIFIKY